MVNSRDHLMSRRDVLLSMGTLTLGVGYAPVARQEPPNVVEIRIARNEALGLWYFEPLGVLVQPGQTVRWRNVHWGATVTAYHPNYDNRELRIPEGVDPFDSGLLGDEQKSTFEWRYDVEGTYDYCSRYQEVLGMFGRVVVGHPGGPGENPLGYGASQGRAPVFRRVSELMLHVPSDRIVRERTVPFPVSALGRKY
jgi:plastocyanin